MNSSTVKAVLTAYTGEYFGGSFILVSADVLPNVAAQWRAAHAARYETEK